MEKILEGEDNRRWRRAAEAAKAAGHEPKQERMKTPLSVQGVGHGSQQCTWSTRIPAAMVLADGTVSNSNFTSPTAPQSDLPALLGLRSLMQHNAVIDCRTRRLYLCGPGDVEITPPPGSEVLQLEQAPSGHLVLPISAYHELERFQANRARAAPVPPALALAASQREEPGTSAENLAASSVAAPLGREFDQ